MHGMGNVKLGDNIGIKCFLEVFTCFMLVILSFFWSLFSVLNFTVLLGVYPVHVFYQELLVKLVIFSNIFLEIYFLKIPTTCNNFLLVIFLHTFSIYWGRFNTKIN